MIVYKATHLPTKMIYIGATIGTLKTRQTQHEGGSDKNTSPIGRIVKAEGKSVFAWEVLWSGDDKTEMLKKEQEFILKFDCVSTLRGFNKSLSGRSANYEKRKNQKWDPNSKASAQSLPERRTVIYRLSVPGITLIEELAQKKGISKTAIIELAVREFSKSN